ncbi:hypothetical protein J3R82DRAFT_11557 [Butyriboletus roseoflavus]|nr:hypothetical protein J3R82DRAFT_11557 [Butyriboletus roseoflavus]
MTQNQGFNYEFSDADAARLLQVASLANHPQHRYHCCGWVTSQGLCNQHIQGHDFSEHLRADHGVVGPDKAQLRCRWVNCFAEMKKESLTRHVQEKHLELRFSCPSCSEQFTRNYTMQNHVLRKHSGS